MSRLTRRGVFASLLVTSLLLSLLSGAASASTPERVGPPDSMASLGDSITRGFHTGGLLQDVPANSWSTGTSTTVNSLYNRLRALNPGMTQTNNALTGARMNDLDRQASTVPPGTDLITVLLGANDVCTSSEATMTPVATYEAQLREGMEVIAATNPDALVYIASVPSILRLWDIGRTSLGARFAWGLYGICQSMLAAPTSVTATDVARRARVQQRVVDFNATLEQVCAEYLRCRFDGNAAFNTPFVLADMSTIDYFHPNVTGQRKAASVLATKLFDFTDVEAPSTVIGTDRDADGVDGWFKGTVDVSLSSDAADLRGSEYDYRISGAEGDLSWTRYGAPIEVEAEGTTSITARSLDLNGNVGAGELREIRIDRTAPSFDLTCPPPAVRGSSAAASISGAADGLSGFLTDPEGTFPLDTSVVGTHTHQAQVQDRAGNTTTRTCTFSVVYGFGGIDQPVNRDGSSVFKLGSTVPLKFGLSDALAASVTDAVATVAVAKVSNGIVGTEVEAASTVAATSGNTFRVSDGQYLFNLATKGLTTGTYQVTITLTGGQQHTATISLR